MKTIKIKTGTKAEILEYLHKKIKGSFNRTEIWQLPLKHGDIFQLNDNTVEDQIDTIIESGSPLLNICLKKCNENDHVVHHTEQFLISNFSEVANASSFGFWFNHLTID